MSAPSRPSGTVTGMATELTTFHNFDVEEGVEQAGEAPSGDTLTDEEILAIEDQVATHGGANDASLDPEEVS